MGTLFSSAGMTAMTASVAVLFILSFLLLWVNLHLFREQSHKYRALLKSLGNEEAWGTPGRVLVPLYLLSTVAATVAIIYLYVFQPHLL